MGYLIFTEKDSYIKSIDELLKECDIFTLDRFYVLLLKHFYPGCV